MERVILMVDDDPDDRELFCEAVDDIDQNIKCYTVDSAEGAIKFLSTSRVIPDIIFLDINMPGMNGWECLARLKKEHRIQDVPIIMYSTSREAIDIRKASELGALCLFIKPDRFTIIKDVLSSIVENIDGNLPAALREFTNIKSLRSS